MNNDKILEVLKGMRELLADKSRWTQRAQARACNGKSLLAGDREAVSFCLFGAINKIVPITRHKDTWQAEFCLQLEVTECLAPLIVKYPPFSSRLVTFNDYSSRTHAEILEVIDMAIAQFRMEPQW